MYTSEIRSRYALLALEFVPIFPHAAPRKNWEAPTIRLRWAARVAKKNIISKSPSMPVVGNLEHLEVKQPCDGHAGLEHMGNI